MKLPQQGGAGRRLQKKAVGAAQACEKHLVTAFRWFAQGRAVLADVQSKLGIDAQHIEQLALPTAVAAWLGNTWLQDHIFGEDAVHTAARTAMTELTGHGVLSQSANSVKRALRCCLIVHSMSSLLLACDTNACTCRGRASSHSLPSVACTGAMAAAYCFARGCDGTACSQLAA